MNPSRQGIERIRSKSPICAPDHRLSWLEHGRIALLWFAYNLQWGALLPVVLPAQVVVIAGPSRKELVNGITLAAGALVASVTAPVAGALSDGLMGPRAGRRIFVITGIVLNAVGLLALGTVGGRGGIGPFVCALLLTQFACNAWGGPYAGFIPDLAPHSEHGRASGYMMLMTGAGTIAGTAAAGPLLNKSGFSGVYRFLALSLIVSAVITLTDPRRPKSAPHLSLSWKDTVRGFFPSPALHRGFYLVLISRAFVTMGAFSILPFLQYFLVDVMRDPKAIVHGSLLMGITGVVTLPVALVAGRRADRSGPWRIVWISGWVMATATAVYLVDCFLPSWPFTIVVAVVFGAASVAYQAVDWALALSVLPDGGRRAGKDMGIWHLSLVLPQSVAPLLAGALLDRAKHVSVSGAYALVFLMTACWYALGTLQIRKLATSYL